ncbi:MAG: hypothetical protein AABO57_26200 [Acidobacteriota bacterium]
MGTFEPRIVAFLDVLGFKDLIDRAARDDNATPIIEALEKALTYVGADNKPSGDFQGQTKMFSDSVIMSGSPTLAGLNWVFWRCIVTQAMFVEYGLLLRGAITQGKHYQSEQLVFSEGVVNSYLLEQRVAKYPRVVVEPSIAKLAQQQGRSFPYPPPDDLILEDEDGVLFLDYFRYITDGPASRVDAVRFPERHREVVEEGARRFAKLPHVLEKYRWMAMYHNRKDDEDYIDIIPFIDVEGLFGTKP